MISIKVATISDLGIIQKLHTELFQYEDRLMKLYNTNYDQSESSKKYFLSRFDPKKGCVFIAVENDSIIGYLCAGKGTEDFRDITQYAEIESLFVSENYRNQGIGKQLIAEFKKWATSLGIRRLKVEVVNTNVSSLKFYVREGFQPTYLELEATLSDS